MHTYLCITSMNEYIYAQTGRTMIQSWIQHWADLDASLDVYFDDAIPPDFPSCGLRLQARSLRREMPCLFDFQTRHQSPICSGIFGRTYDYRRDAKKFAFKPASIAHASQAPGPETHLVWLDADTLWHQPLSDAFLQGVFPDTATIGTFTRANYHSECGIIFYDLRRPHTYSFIADCWATYTTDTIFRLPSWTDCDVYDTMAAHYAKHYYPSFQAINLGTDASHRTGHPIINSPWAAYLDHLKGNRKTAGASYASDKVLPA